MVSADVPVQLFNLQTKQTGLVCEAAMSIKAYTTAVIHLHEDKSWSA